MWNSFAGASVFCARARSLFARVAPRPASALFARVSAAVRVTQPACRAICGTFSGAFSAHRRRTVSRAHPASDALIPAPVEGLPPCRRRTRGDFLGYKPREGRSGPGGSGARCPSRRRMQIPADVCVRPLKGRVVGWHDSLWRASASSGRREEWRRRKWRSHRSLLAT